MSAAVAQTRPLAGSITDPSILRGSRVVVVFGFDFIVVFPRTRKCIPGLFCAYYILSASYIFKIRFISTPWGFFPRTYGGSGNTAGVFRNAAGVFDNLFPSF
jgi:hypothetical protein